MQRKSENNGFLQDKHVVKVSISLEMLMDAVRMAYTILPYHIRDFSPSGLDEFLRSVIGHAGQFAVLFHLDNKSWKTRASEIPVGTPDNGDFEYRGYAGDVKSAAIAQPPRLLVTVRDFEAHQDDLYVLVWVRLELGEAWILGWAWAREVASAPVDWTLIEPAHAMTYGVLHDMEEFRSLPPKASLSS
ncbi:hypothetical protein E6H29_02035 [Candidatus Bathyarchaeota archaeon]|nr:MAG: hypothetical protein E6H29_02035 [Candidatus Bathyarchaeota archaeon]